LSHQGITDAIKPSLRPPSLATVRFVVFASIVLTAFHFMLAHPLLFAYGYVGLSSLGHFLSGSPDQFTTRGLVSVLVDGVAGSAVLAVTVWSIVAHRRETSLQVPTGQ
jgi:hypothetical protein